MEWLQNNSLYSLCLIGMILIPVLKVTFFTAKNRTLAGWLIVAYFALAVGANFFIAISLFFVLIAFLAGSCKFSQDLLGNVITALFSVAIAGTMIWIVMQQPDEFNDLLIFTNKAKAVITFCVGLVFPWYVFSEFYREMKKAVGLT